MTIDQNIAAKLVGQLNRALVKSGIAARAFASIAGVNYVTFNKYVNGQRMITNPEIADKLTQAIEDINGMVERGILPLPAEISRKHRSRIVLREYKKFKNQD